jgi:hypothetical protein
VVHSACLVSCLQRRVCDADTSTWRSCAWCSWSTACHGSAFPKLGRHLQHHAVLLEPVRMTAENAAFSVSKWCAGLCGFFQQPQWSSAHHVATVHCMPPRPRRPWAGAPQEGLLVEGGPDGLTLAGFLARWAALTVRQPRRWAPQETSCGSACPCSINLVPHAGSLTFCSLCFRLQACRPC